MFTEIDIIFRDHQTAVEHGLNSVDKLLLETAGDKLQAAIVFRNNIFTCGNGASAAIAQHWACDYTKGCSDLTHRNIAPKVISLSSNVPLMTAIANDISYDEVYSYQLERLADRGDVLITISSSGNSPNVVKAIETARKMGVLVIALTGFDGGKAKQLAHIPIHVDLPEYEATEDCHQAIMHILAKYIRVSMKLWSH